MLTLDLRWTCCAAFLLAASVVLAANVVPGLDVLVVRGSSVVFRGVTDDRGRFGTGPLEPGVYSIEVRTAPNAPPSSARFFLSLAGARPLGDATIRPGVALAMSALVRNPAGIRGQVAARGGIVYVPSTVLASDRSANRATPPAPAVTAPTPPLAPKFGQVAKPATSNRPVAANSAWSQTSARPVAGPSPAPTIASPESPLVRRPVGYQPRIINGRRYFWTPTAPGSNLGRWLPESVSRPLRTAPANSNPAPTPSPTPSQTRR